MAIYVELVEQNLRSAPVELGYFIFDSQALLVTTSSVFPDAEVCTPRAGTSVKQVVSMAEASWRWRREQLGAEELEVVDPRLGDIEEFQGPQGTLPVAEPKPWDRKYLVLMGWEEGA